MGGGCACGFVCACPVDGVRVRLVACVVVWLCLMCDWSVACLCLIVAVRVECLCVCLFV